MAFDFLMWCPWLCPFNTTDNRERINPILFAPLWRIEWIDTAYLHCNLRDTLAFCHNTLFQSNMIFCQNHLKKIHLVCYDYSNSSKFSLCLKYQWYILQDGIQIIVDSYHKADFLFTSYSCIYILYTEVLLTVKLPRDFLDNCDLAFSFIFLLFVVIRTW